MRGSSTYGKTVNFLFLFSVDLLLMRKCTFTNIVLGWKTLLKVLTY